MTTGARKYASRAVTTHLVWLALCVAGPSPRAQDTGHFLINPAGTIQQPPTNSVSSCMPMGATRSYASISCVSALNMCHARVTFVM